MLSGIANYLFGATSSSTANEEEMPANMETPGNHGDHQDEAKLRLRTSTEDNEWVLVDKSSSGQAEKHPLEDLLIEHPSMSVYGPRGRPSSTGHDSEDSSPGDQEPTSRVGPQAGRAVAPRQHRPRTLMAAKASLKATVVAKHSMQRATKRHEQRRHAKSAMQRSNRVSHYNAHPHRQRRKDHMLTPSGRSNNRKQHS